MGQDATQSKTRTFHLKCSVGEHAQKLLQPAELGVGHGKVGIAGPCGGERRGHIHLLGLNRCVGVPKLHKAR